MSHKPRLTPEQDAAIYEELRPELPKIRKVVDKAGRQIEMLSDIGQVAAIVELTMEVILRHVPDEDAALALSDHLRSQVDVGIKMVFTHHEAPPHQQ
ncbi:hypothetical protein [Nitratireductor luteus]|uniref:hypothetical protein n=1 Tax=Nitratireductor luteus TaxID=2976980 RepID=UPI002240A187|nr:hypothetical protein [Nitratireductor luteus]